MKISANESDVDHILIEKAQKGDSKAFDMLVIKYRNRLMLTLNRFVKDEHEIQDIVQDTFIKAYKALPNFRGDSAFFTWLYRIAVNSAKNYLASYTKKNVILNKDLQPEDNETDWIEQTPDFNTPEAAFLNNEIINTVNTAVEKLPTELRQTFTLREMEGYSYEEIAEQMNCPVGTVRSRLFRARELIAKDLRPVLDTTENRRW